MGTGPRRLGSHGDHGEALPFYYAWTWHYDLRPAQEPRLPGLPAAAVRAGVPPTSAGALGELLQGRMQPHARQGVAQYAHSPALSGAHAGTRAPAPTAEAVPTHRSRMPGEGRLGLSSAMGSASDSAGPPSCAASREEGPTAALPGEPSRPMPPPSQPLVTRPLPLLGVLEPGSGATASRLPTVGAAEGVLGRLGRARCARGGELAAPAARTSGRSCRSWPASARAREPIDASAASRARWSSIRAERLSRSTYAVGRARQGLSQP
jgi:hypothetical protein